MPQCRLCDKYCPILLRPTVSPVLVTVLLAILVFSKEREGKRSRRTKHNTHKNPHTFVNAECVRLPFNAFHPRRGRAQFWNIFCIQISTLWLLLLLMASHPYSPLFRGAYFLFVDFARVINKFKSVYILLFSCVFVLVLYTFAVCDPWTHSVPWLEMQPCGRGWATVCVRSCGFYGILWRRRFHSSFFFCCCSLLRSGMRVWTKRSLRRRDEIHSIWTMWTQNTTCNDQQTNETHPHYISFVRADIRVANSLSIAKYLNSALAEIWRTE